MSKKFTTTLAVLSYVVISHITGVGDVDVDKLVAQVGALYVAVEGAVDAFRAIWNKRESK